MGDSGWNPAWETGHATLDGQHRQLFVQLEWLLESVVGGDGREETERTLLHLSDYIHFHFALEEQVMLESGFPGLRAQREAHDAMRAQVTTIVRGYVDGKATVTADLLDYLRVWLVNHLDTLDADLAAWLRREDVTVG